MGYETRVTGMITVDPPFTAPEIRHIKTLGIHGDVKLRIAEQSADTEYGEMISRTGKGIIPAHEGAWSYYYLAEDITKIIDGVAGLAGAPDHRYGGHLKCVGEDGDISRVVIRDGTVVAETPKLLWPDGTEEEM